MDCPAELAKPSLYHSSLSWWLPTFVTKLGRVRAGTHNSELRGGEKLASCSSGSHDGSYETGKQPGTGF